MAAQVGKMAQGRVAEQVSWVAAQVEVAAQLGEARRLGVAVAVQTWVVAEERAGQRAHRHARAQLGVLVVHLDHDGLLGAQRIVARDDPALHVTLHQCVRCSNALRMCRESGNSLGYSVPAIRTQLPNDVIR